MTRTTTTTSSTAASAGRSLRPQTLALMAGLALLGAGQTQAQISSAPAAAQATPREAAGPGRGSDPARQAALAANQQADAAFQRADTNGDGRLSRAEADHLPAIAARFEQLDANRDQFISREEFNRVLVN